MYEYVFIAFYVVFKGFQLVLDTTVSRELSLLETYKEFISRRQRYESGDKTALPMLTGICPGRFFKSLTTLYSKKE